MSGSPLDGRRPGRLSGLPRRIYLTLRYRGVRALIYQTVVFPLRLTPLDRLLGLGPGTGREARAARAWYRAHGRPVTIVIPSYRDAKLVARLVAAIRRTTDSARACGSSSPTTRAAPSTWPRSHGSRGSRSSRASTNRGFSANVNRGLAAAGAGRGRRAAQLRRGADARLARLPAARRLQRSPARGSSRRGCCTPTTASSTPARSATRRRRSGSTTATASRTPTGDRPTSPARRSRPPRRRCTSPRTPAGRSASSTRRCRWATRTSTTACAPGRPGGACTTRRRRPSTTRSRRRAAAPSASASGSPSAPSGPSGRELLDGPRRVTGEDGRVQIIYVMQETVVGGGPRLVFEHLNHLAARGHDVALWTLDGPPDWFELHCPVRVFADFDALERALAPLHAIKVATWWNTAATVWRASVVNGRGVYYVQDIETSYYADDPDAPPRRARLLSARARLRDRVRLEPRAARRARTRRRARAAGPRPRQCSTPARRSSAATTWCSRSGAPTR